MGGNTSLRAYHSLALVFLLILFVLSLELCVVELRLVYLLPCGSLCVVHLCFYELMVIGEMAMELLSGFSSLAYTEFHID
jgi:hypothetical protein